jgi:hypothetical protein
MNVLKFITTTLIFLLISCSAFAYTVSVSADSSAVQKGDVIGFSVDYYADFDEQEDARVTYAYIYIGGDTQTYGSRLEGCTLTGGSCSEYYTWTVPYDAPATTYTYYVEAKFCDDQGCHPHIRSNTGTFTVEESKPEVEPSLTLTVQPARAKQGETVTFYLDVEPITAIISNARLKIGTLPEEDLGYATTYKWTVPSTMEPGTYGCILTADIEYEGATYSKQAYASLIIEESSSEERKYYVGERITGLKGSGNYFGQTLEIEFVTLVYDQSGTYRAKFNLYDEEGSLIDTRIVPAGTFLEKTFYADGEYPLATSVYISSIGKDTNDRGYVTVIIQEAQTTTSASIQVEVDPNPFMQGETTTFKVSGTNITEIEVSIFDLTGRKVFYSDWVGGNSYTWDGVANVGTYAGSELRAGAYIYLIKAKTVSGAEGISRGFVYIESASTTSEATSKYVSRTTPGVKVTTASFPFSEAESAYIKTLDLSISKGPYRFTLRRLLNNSSGKVKFKWKVPNDAEPGSYTYKLTLQMASSHKTKEGRAITKNAFKEIEGTINVVTVKDPCNLSLSAPDTVSLGKKARFIVHYKCLKGYTIKNVKLTVERGKYSYSSTRAPSARADEAGALTLEWNTSEDFIEVVSGLLASSLITVPLGKIPINKYQYRVDVKVQTPTRSLKTESYSGDIVVTKPI